MVVAHFRVLPHGEGLAAPSYRSELAAGLDLAAAVAEGEAIEILPGRRMLVPTGVALELPAGFEGQLRPRSGLALRHGIGVLNAPGTIDADYRGEIKVLLINFGEDRFLVRRGDRIAQLVVSPVTRVSLEITASLSSSARGENGFGSTGV